MEVSIRDYFAAHVISGIMSRDVAHEPKDWARVAYEYADAMLKAREIAK